MISGYTGAWGFHAATTYRGTGRRVASEVSPSAVLLPAPQLPEWMRDALDRRMSCRQFSTDPMSVSELSNILHAAYGLLGEAAIHDTTFGHRPVPSAGAKYPLRIYVIARTVTDVQPAVYQYEPERKSLKAVGGLCSDEALCEMLLGQPYVTGASAVILLAAELQLTLDRYADRGYRYVLFEAGHAVQNMSMLAAGMGIGGLAIGGFLDPQVAELLHLEPHVVPLYAYAIGKPDATSTELRTPDRALLES